MNIRKSLVACLMITPVLALSPAATTASQLSSSQGVFDESGGVLAPEVYFPGQEEGDLYLVTVVDGETYYITPTDLTLEPTPFLVNQTYLGSVALPQWGSLGIPPNNYPLLQFVVVPGGDPLDVRNWVGGLRGLNQIQFKVLGPDDVDEDRDNDGWLDDDLNRDGFHDDDLDKDGFHDSDLDHDGFPDGEIDEKIDDEGGNRVSRPESSRAARGAMAENTCCLAAWSD